jgi:hypothetical protein
MEYDPVTSTWITVTATFSDVNTSNTQGGVLTMDGTPVIIVVGGSPGTASGASTETRVYNPIDDTMVTLTSDPWTPGSTTVPGGAAVVNNKLYIFGGYTINTAMTSEIWEFDPDATPGFRWTLLPTILPHELGYIPTTAIDNIIYMAGGSRWDGTTLVDTKDTLSFDPTTGIITQLAAMPRITAETKALNISGKMWVLGGGRIAPNPSNEVDIYDPSTDTWTTGLTFAGPRRNFPADTDGAGNIYLAGGYDAVAVDPYTSMEIYNPLMICGTTTPTPVP